MTTEAHQAVHRATSIFKLCPNRVWSIVNSLGSWEARLPELIPSFARGEVMKIIGHKGHEFCTFDFCEHSRLDFTSVAQRHESPICTRNPCQVLKDMFPTSVLDKASLEEEPTAWELSGTTTIKAPQPFMAVSHVWSDGTGAGSWPAGQVNECLYNFFRDIAERFECTGLWWDTICLPRSKAAKIKALNNMQQNYEKARITLVHDCYIRQWQWIDAETACFAIIMSPWFSRGWTALELAKSRRVKVIFKDMVIKDLDFDILSQSETDSARHKIATDIIKSLRKAGMNDLNNLLAVLGPRSTSWPRDVAIISGLLAGIEIPSRPNQQAIYQAVLRRFGRVDYGHLFHRMATMQGGFSWCPTNLIALPTTTVPRSRLQLSHSGHLTGDWFVVDLKSVPEERYVFNTAHPMSELGVRLALQDANSHALLVEPDVVLIYRAILVKMIATATAEDNFEFVGPIYLNPPFPLNQISKDLGRLRKARVTLGPYQNNMSGDSGSESDSPARWIPSPDEYSREPSYPPELRRDATTEEKLDEASGGRNWRFLKAVINGDEETAKSMLPRVDADFKDDASWTALHHAVWGGYREIVQLLLEDGAEVDIKDTLDQQVFHLAAERADHSIASMLFKYVKKNHELCRDGQTVLHRAVLGGSYHVVNTVVRILGAMINSQDSQGKTAVHMAAELGSTKILDLLLSKKANPRIKCNRGRTAMHYAAMHWHGNDEAITTLLRYDEVNIPDNRLRMPLHYATANGRIEIVKVLVQHTSLAVTDSKGQTALHVAARNEHLDILHFLLHQNKSLDLLSDSIKRNCLFIAASRGSLPVFRELINHGADPWWKDHRGRTVFMLAVNSKTSLELEMYIAEMALSTPGKDHYIPRSSWYGSENRDYSGKNPTTERLLKYAMENGHMHVVCDIIHHIGPRNFDILERTPYNQSVLQIALTTGRRELIYPLLVQYREMAMQPATVEDQMIRNGRLYWAFDQTYTSTFREMFRRARLAKEIVKEARRMPCDDTEIRGLLNSGYFSLRDSSSDDSSSETSSVAPAGKDGSLQPQGLPSEEASSSSVLETSPISPDDNHHYNYDYKEYDYDQYKLIGSDTDDCTEEEDPESMYSLFDSQPLT